MIEIMNYELFFKGTLKNVWLTTHVGAFINERACGGACGCSPHVYF